jgi:hypothetical protein
MGNTIMARDYLNLPATLDALEDEMDREASAVIEAARKVQERGLAEMKRAHGAIKVKNTAIDRMQAFADNMEARNTSNGAPPLAGGASSTNSTETKPGETAHLGAKS